MTKQQPIQEVVRPHDEEQSQALRSLLGSAKPLSVQEQRKRQTKMKTIAKQQGEQAVDTFLSEQLGLDF